MQGSWRRTAGRLARFIADLCSHISWAIDPRADGYASDRSDERNYAEGTMIGSAIPASIMNLDTRA